MAPGLEQEQELGPGLARVLELEPAPPPARAVHLARAVHQPIFHHLYLKAKYYPVLRSRRRGGPTDY